ncbi:MAG TPA: packaged DNA stabilization gp4 family protein [Ramlibacter sp.]|uniref:packaged DNA stabilization gp4 family protein n=1 Tax=Ramlibacter sp. TaxID=1917967 RepID=UPI002ED18E36
MTTKQELIEQALAEFGITSAFDVSPEELQEGLKRLNRIAAQWDGIGIRVGFNLGGGLEDSVGIPDTAEDAFATNLALRWASSFGKTVGADTRKAAAQGFNALYTARAPRPEVPQSSRLPLGAGNRMGTTGRQYFPETNEIPGLNDGATEY